MLWISMYPRARAFQVLQQPKHVETLRNLIRIKDCFAIPPRKCERLGGAICWRVVLQPSPYPCQVRLRRFVRDWDTADAQPSSDPPRLGAHEVLDDLDELAK
jgi:hypothetical protein